MSAVTSRRHIIALRERRCRGNGGAAKMTWLWDDRAAGVFHLLRQLSGYAYRRECRNCLVLFLRDQPIKVLCARSGLADSLLCPLVSVMIASGFVASFSGHGCPPGLGLSIQPEFNPGNSAFFILRHREGILPRRCVELPF